MEIWQAMNHTLERIEFLEKVIRGNGKKFIRVKSGYLLRVDVFDFFYISPREDKFLVEGGFVDEKNGVILSKFDEREDAVKFIDQIEKLILGEK